VRGEVNQVRDITAVATDSWDSTAIWREQLSNSDLGLILEETEAGKRPEWKEIADRSYWAQWKSLAVRDIERVEE
jgi:hypothetical protein